MPEVSVNPNDDKNQKEDQDEHNKKMKDKVKEGTNTGDSGDNDDELLAGKYENEEELQKGVLEAVKNITDAEDLEEAYKELGNDLHPDNSDTDADEGGGESEGEEGDGDKDDLRIDNDDGDGEEEDVDFSKFEEEFAENGELSEDSIEELEEMGYDRSFIQRYVKGLQAEVQEFNQEIYEVAGGKETYEEMIAWANENLSDQEVEFFNEALESENVDRAKMVVESLYHRYETNSESKPNLVRGKKQNSQSSGNAYESRKELMNDMQDPKYHNDPAFRKKVAEKLARSNVL